MQSSLLADDDERSAAGLVAAVTRRGTPGHYDEWRGRLSEALATGQPAPAVPPVPHWSAFFNSLGRAGWADLAARQKRIQQRVREDGATYNVYADNGDHSRPWPLALLPAIITPPDWAVIEHGVLQRARLMEATMADLYGPQQLLRDALLPASLVHGHPHYLRAAHGLVPAGGTHLHIVAFDLARTALGGWCVLAQRLQAPSGLGYLLENRLIVAPQFQDQFAALNVQRLAASFRHLLNGLLRASPAGERSRIVLLTPGPLNETYFEQVFLARYLGITLVEGSDLTVRGQRLFLKTLHGLEQVHVVLRRVDDEFLDPLELRADSALGVPGLLQALRAGQVVMANAPGAGVLESPGLAAFWPAVSRRLLKQELLLPASTSWWCGEAAVWRHQREHLDDFVVAPTFPSARFGPRVVAQMSASERATLVARIDADPAAYTLQARVLPGETPVWADSQLQPRAAVLRVFALSDGSGGWRVLPGAMTRVAGANAQGQHAPLHSHGKAGAAAASQDPWLSMQHGSASVDTWVIASGAVDTSSMLPQPLKAEELTGWHRSVTSRAAENLFWLGRYTERAENCVRLARLVLEVMPDASEPALRLLGLLASFHQLVGPNVPSPLKAPRLFERALVHGLAVGHQGKRPGHQRGLQPARAAPLRPGPARAAVARALEADPRGGRPLRAARPGRGRPGRRPCARPRRDGRAGPAPPPHLAAITGAQTDRMTRDDGWRLLSVGRQIERLDMLAHALAKGFELKVHEADDGFALLLGIFDSVITYRAQFQARREVLPLLHLLVTDTDNPRSLAWVARTMRDRLRKLARHDPLWVAEVSAGLPDPEGWDLAELARTDDDGRHTALITALRQCSSAARQLSDEIGRRLFVHVASPDRTVWQ